MAKKKTTFKTIKPKAVHLKMPSMKKITIPKSKSYFGRLK